MAKKKATKKRKPTLKLGQLRVASYTGKKKIVSRILGEFRLKLDISGAKYDDFEYEDNWILQRKRGSRWDHAGHFSVLVRCCKVSIASSDIEEQYQGAGLGKMSYTELAAYYGSLESDSGGCTSDEAKRVWKSLKAKKLPGGRYRLEAS